MKRLLAVLALAFSTQMAFAQLDNLEKIFHSGPESEKVSQVMAKDMTTDTMAAAEAAKKSGKELSEEQIAELAFNSVKNHADELKTAMQSDCSVNNDAKACACYYEKIDMNQVFAFMKEAALTAKSEEDVQKKMQPIVDDAKAKKAQCDLK